MSTGRKTKGVGHVDNLVGGDEEKVRLKAILATFSGEVTVAEASRQLGISTSRFAKLRTEALQGALDRLAPHPVGRPAKEEDEMAQLKEEMEQQLERSQAERMILRTLLQVGQGILDEEREKKGFTPGEGRRKKKR